MTVLKGEGKVPILFGSTSIAVGTLTRQGYLARPDLAGEWPTIIVVASEWGVTAAVKDFSRRLARHGFAAIAPDLYRGSGPERSVEPEAAARAARMVTAQRAAADLDAIVEFISNPAGFWSSAESGFGVLGFGEGARFAVPFAGSSVHRPLALVSPRLAAPPPDVDWEGQVTDPPDYPNTILDTVVGPILGLSGREDETNPVGDVTEFRARAPHSEWVLYDGVGSHFTDDSAEGYDAEAHLDALERITEFFEKHLP